MKKSVIVAGGFCAAFLFSSFQAHAGLPDREWTPETDKEKQDTYVLTQAQTVVGGCTREAREDPDKLHSAYITGRLAIHEADNHKIKNLNDLRELLDKFEGMLKHAWTTEGSLHLSVNQFGNFEEDPETGKPIFNPDFTTDREVQDRIQQATQQAESQFAHKHGIDVDVKSVRFKELGPGCGL